MENFDINTFVNEIFEEDQLYKSCIQNILKNLDRAIENAGNNRSRIGRLMMMKSFVEKQAFTDEMPSQKGSRPLTTVAA